MACERSSLHTLPDDVLFLLLDCFDTARDVAHLDGTCRRLHLFMRQHGWPKFVRRGFPWLSSASGLLPSRRDLPDDDGNDGRLRWDQLANSLTWQSRAWDRRSLSFRLLTPRGEAVKRLRRQPAFQPPLAVHFQVDLAEGSRGVPGSGRDGEEMVVWGAGEDIVARYRRRGQRTHISLPADTAEGERAFLDPTTQSVWHVLDGQAVGYEPRHDDVRALSIVPNALGQPRRRGILAGRDSGDLSLLSAETDGFFGQVLTRFRPEDDDVHIDQSQIFSLDVSANSSTASAFGGSNSNSNGLAAVTTPSHILFYSLPQDFAPRVAPAAAFALRTGRRRPYAARWLASDQLLAVGMDGQADQLSYLAATPTGCVRTAAAKSRSFTRRFGLHTQAQLLPSSLEPLSPAAVTGGRGNLLLSAWKDSTIRLQDLRSPSPWDLVYQDSTWSACSPALLVVDGERFVAGDQTRPTLRFFDLRWPKPYVHTAALPCGSDLPMPPPPFQPGTLLPPPTATPALSRCSPTGGQRDFTCRWHATAPHLYYRPCYRIHLEYCPAFDLTFVPAGVCSLARAAGDSDIVPPNFYAGLHCCVVEATLVGDPCFAYPDPQDDAAAPAPPTGFWRRCQRALHLPRRRHRRCSCSFGVDDAVMCEIGDGLASNRRPGECWLESSSRIQSGSVTPAPTPAPTRRSADPRWWEMDGPHPPLPLSLHNIDPALRQRHRFDPSLQQVNDFRDYYGARPEDDIRLSTGTRLQLGLLP